MKGNNVLPITWNARLDSPPKKQHTSSHTVKEKINSAYLLRNKERYVADITNPLEVLYNNDYWKNASRFLHSSSRGLKCSITKAEVATWEEKWISSLLWDEHKDSIAGHAERRIRHQGLEHHLHVSIGFAVKSSKFPISVTEDARLRLPLRGVLPLPLSVCGRCRRTHSACVDAEGWRPLESEAHAHCLDGEEKAHVLWSKRVEKPQRTNSVSTIVILHARHDIINILQYVMCV